jgi:hypothetical protein
MEANELEDSIKSNELRVGNYGIKNGTQNELVIASPSIISAMFVGKFPCLKPIPLTEEWLIKFGFKHDEILSTYVFNGSFGFIENNYTKLGIEYGAIWTECKYVHQLQNIIFALTGEELTIKESAPKP